MKLFFGILLVSASCSAGEAKDSNTPRNTPHVKRELQKRGKTFTAPHEVHEYEQVKFFDEPKWACEFEDIGGKAAACMRCWNPGNIGDEALIVEVKSQYKRADWNIRDETIDPPRKHCIWPKRGDFWTCFNYHLVIEPDTDWLEGNLDGVPFSYRDRPIYDEDGGEGDQCLPGRIVASLPDNGAIQPRS